MSARLVAASSILPLEATDAWNLLVDVRNHASWVPMTRVETLDEAPRLGTQVVAVSGPFARRGAPGLVDRMRIDRFEPPNGTTPGEATFTKLGPVLRGEARIRVVDAGPGRARVTWTEEICLRGPFPAEAFVGALITRMLRHVFAAVAQEVDQPR